MIGPSRHRQEIATRAVGLAFALALSTCVLSVAHAQESAVDGQVGTLTNSAEKLEAQRKALVEAEAEAERRKTDLQSDLSNIATEQAVLNKRLIETAALVQKTEAEMTAIEGRLANLEVQEQQIRTTLTARYAKIAKLLSALQRMGRNPPPVMITRREDALKMVRSAMLLSKAFPEMRDQALTLSTRLNNLMQVMGSIRAERDNLREKTERINTTRTQLASLMDTKKQSIGERQAELKRVRQATAEISKSVTDLNELISRLGTEVKKTEAAAEFESRANNDAPPGDQVASLAPDAGLKDKDGAAKPRGGSVVELAPAEDSGTVSGNTARMTPVMAFPLLKGKLPLPAQGRRLLSFGEKTQYGGNSKGVVLETRYGAQVTSPCDGWVVYAGEFRSYGQLLIIDPGGGYHILVAGMSGIDAQPGQFVLAAEPVGTMAGPPRTAGLEVQKTGGDSALLGAATPNLPVLYLEFRKDGQPIDPDPWWVASIKKVQD